MKQAKNASIEQFAPDLNNRIIKLQEFHLNMQALGFEKSAEAARNLLQKEVARQREAFENRKKVA